MRLIVSTLDAVDSVRETHWKILRVIVKLNSEACTDGALHITKPTEFSFRLPCVTYVDVIMEIVPTAKKRETVQASLFLPVEYQRGM